MPRCAMFSTLGVNLHEKKCDFYACQTVLFVTFFVVISKEIWGKILFYIFLLFE